MKRNRSLIVLALLAALPFAAAAQHSGLRDKMSAQQSDTPTKYSAMIGYSYTGINQVNQSRYGLQGVKFGVGRDYKKYYALAAEFSYYKYAVGSGNGGNPGDPSVTQLLFAPELHAELWGRWGGFVHGLVGMAHTGGENMDPSTSAAYGFGGGLQCRLKNNLALRFWGDNVSASFSLRDATPSNAYSAHTTRNGQATAGLIYRF